MATNTALIEHICFQPLDAVYAANRYDSFIRQRVDEAHLVAGHGIRGDRKARPGGRQLNLVDRDWLAQMAERGFRTGPGEMGEQLQLSGIELLALPPGTRLQLGESAQIELTRPRDGCTRLQAAQASKDPVLLGHIGQLARVICGGVIRLGDPVVRL